MLAVVLNVSFSWLLTGAGEGLDAPGNEPDLSQDTADLLTERVLYEARSLLMFGVPGVPGGRSSPTAAAVTCSPIHWRPTTRPCAR